MRFTAFLWRAAMRRATAPLTIFTIKVAVVPPICDRDECEVVVDHRVRNRCKKRHCQDLSSSSMSGIISYIGSGFARQASIPVMEGPLTPMSFAITLRTGARSFERTWTKRDRHRQRDPDHGDRLKLFRQGIHTGDHRDPECRFHHPRLRARMINASQEVSERPEDDQGLLRKEDHSGKKSGSRDEGGAALIRV